MFHQFSQPFPYQRTVKQHLLSAGGIGLFVFLFLLVLQPFGLSNYQSPYKPLVFAGYGLVSFVIPLVLNLLMPLLFSEEKWTVGRHILFTLFSIFCIGVGNLLYSVAIGFYSLTWQWFLTIQAFTILIGIFPTVFFILSTQNKLLKQNLNAANTLSAQLHTREPEDGAKQQVTLKSDNQNEDLELTAGNICCILSADNYIEVYWVTGNELNKKLIRSTLKRAEENLQGHANFYRCHRTALVNLHRVTQVTGNSQGYKLIVHPQVQGIPVSRNLNKEIAEKLSK